MKRITLTLMIGVCAGGVAAAQIRTGADPVGLLHYASISGRQHPPSAQRPMIDEVTTRNMAELMNQIRNMLSRAVRILGQERTLNSARAQDMSRIILRMSGQLRDISRGMNDGTMDRARMRSMQRNMRKIGIMIHEMEQRQGT